MPRAVTSELARQLGSLLAESRKARSLSLRELSRLVKTETHPRGVSNSVLRALEAGHDNPTLARVEEAARWYGIEVEIRIKKITPAHPGLEAALAPLAEALDAFRAAFRSIRVDIPLLPRPLSPAPSNLDETEPNRL